ncbi:MULTISPECIES: cache domain-containing sensor histidine kinase [Paenibacillus]|uniref:cache domain-containing sensor histidine kinase n=1 Tax=Paenibacillus TaxID=44249 RepID=UPI0022B8D4DC|nr:sensor histidine kinase [Paenibacillus caseinilyticus]MCZ8520450.1 sensor histidine kinase [Paenibacillus caseinilyticus]
MVIPILAVGTVVSILFQQAVQKKYAEQSKLVISSMARNIATVFKEATYYSDNWMLSPSVQNFLNAPETGQDSQGVYTILNQTFLTYAPLDTVALYTLDGKAYSRTKLEFNPVPFPLLESHSLFGKVVRGSGLSTWIGPHEAPELTGDNSYFTQIRTVADLIRLERIGYVYLQYNFGELDDIFGFYSNVEDSSVEDSSEVEKNTHYMLVNRQGTILYDNLKVYGGGSLFEYTRTPVDLGQVYSSEKMFFGGSWSIVTVQPLPMKDLGIEDWTLVSVTPSDYVVSDTGRMIRWSGMIVSGILFSAFFFHMLFIRRYSQFILRFVGVMKEVERGNLEARIYSEIRDETTVLTRGFNSLVKRVAELIDEVKLEQARKNKAELLLLQAQIKPHFLFNTLESINALAVKNRGDLVSQLVYRLGTILRISFREGEEISVGTEIGYLRHYIEIQKIRFGKRFEYELEMPGGLADYSILKFTLQPLVENSIQHGFDDIDHQGLVRIRAEDTGEAISLWVEDNGSGIPPEVLERISRRRGGSSLREIREPGASEGGLGLRNVADRLCIHYGPRYGMWICSAPGAGTRIRCVIPKQKLGDAK